MARLGRRFPVHRGFNPHLLAEPVGVTRDSIGPGNYVNGASVNVPWTHTPVGKPNLVIMWLCLLYQGGGVNATLNGVTMTTLFNYNWQNYSGYAGYTEGFIMWNPPPGPWNMLYYPGTGTPYATCNSVAYNNVGSIGATIQGNTTPLTIASHQNGVISTGSAGWITVTGQYAKLAPPPGADIYDAPAGECMSMGEIPGNSPTQTINWASTAADGYGLCAMSLLPKIPQPML